MPPKQRTNRVETPEATHRPSTRLIVMLIGAAVVVAAGAIALSLTLGGDHKTAATPTITPGGLSLVHGIPQTGLELGNPKAKVTLTEYIDTSCPICRDYVLTTFPAIVKKYVQTGKVKIDAQPLGIIGPSSERGRRLFLAAAIQNKAWDYAEVVYHNKGDETTAWLTDAVARALAKQVPGLNVDQLFADSDGAGISVQAAAIDAQAQTDGVSGTPTFVLTTGDGKRHLLGAGDPGFAAFAGVLDRALNA